MDVSKGKIAELNNGKKVFLSWDEIYSLCGCVQEDFLYDSSGYCYEILLKSLDQSTILDYSTATEMLDNPPKPNENLLEILELDK